MRKIFILGTLGALLAGCAGAYDRDAVPVAGSAYKLAVDRCGSKPQPGLSALFECYLAADKQFATAIKLSPMGLYDNYASRMRLLAVDSVANHVPPEDVGKRYNAIKGDYINSIAAAQDNAEIRQAQAAAAMGAMGQAAERQADRDAMNRPLNCTSTAFGGTVNTTCH